jgi:uridine kinase
MRGDRILIEVHHYRAAREIVRRILPQVNACERCCALTVAGEAGSGKSETALGLAEVFEEKGLSCVIFQQDDYFVHPPLTNEATRRKDISWVGPQEVRLDLLDQHIMAAKTGVNAITKPLIHYQEDCITEETVDLAEARVVIAEGTYTSLLQNVDLRVFIARDWQDTYEARIKRGRDLLDEFNQEVMKIEHGIISRHKAIADIVIQRDFKVEFVTV